MSESAVTSRKGVNNILRRVVLEPAAQGKGAGEEASMKDGGIEKDHHGPG